MATNENQKEETFSCRDDWEVVSLTASTYAAAPGPKGFESINNEKNEVFTRDEEYSPAMFMSSHFVFPPCQHEDVPLDPDSKENQNELRGEDLEPTQVCALGMLQGEEPKKAAEENWNIKGFSEVDEMEQIQLFDEMAKGLSVHATEFEEQGLNVVEGKNVFTATEFSSFHAEANSSGSTNCVERAFISDPNSSAQLNLDSPLALSESQKVGKEEKYNASGLPCEAWWKRHAASLYNQAKEANTFWSLYNQAKEANTFWSVVAAAALMGFVIFGQRCQHGGWQIQHLRWQFSISNEKIKQMLGSFSGFKDMIVGSHQETSLSMGSSKSAE